MEKLSRQEQKEKTRTGLVERAEALFAKHGIGGTTTAEVAKALKVSHGTVFIHFATRDDLVLAVVERFGERLSEALGRRLTAELPLRELLRAHLAVLAEFEDFYLRLISESQSLPKRVRAIQYAMNSALSYQFFHAAKEPMRAGEIKKLEQAVFFKTWMALIHYYIMNRDLFSEKTPVLRELESEILRHFYLLIKP